MWISSKVHRILRTKSFLSPFIKRKQNWPVNQWHNTRSPWHSVGLWDSKKPKQQIKASTWQTRSQELKIADATKATATGTEVGPWLQVRPGLEAGLTWGFSSHIKHTWLFSPSLNKGVRFCSLGAEATCPTRYEGSRGTFPCGEHKDNGWFCCWGQISHLERYEQQKHVREKPLPLTSLNKSA